MFLQANKIYIITFNRNKTLHFLLFLYILLLLGVLFPAYCCFEQSGDNHPCI